MTDVTSGNTLDITFNQISAGVTVESGGTLNVLFGGTVIDTAVGGTENVLSGGTAINNLVDSGGFEHVFNGGTAIGTDLVSGGKEDVEFDGTAVGTSVGKDSFLFVKIGGTTSGTTVSSGGTEQVGGGTAIGTVVNSGGFEEVFGGTIGTVVNSGGTEIVFDGGIASGTTIAGGTVEVAGGGSIGSGPITFTNAGGILQLDDSQHFHGLLASFASPSGVTEGIDLGDISFGKKTKVSFKEAQGHLSGTLTVTDGTNSASLTLLGQYSTADFTLASDDHGGTMVTDPQHHPSLVGSAGSPVLAPPA